MGSETWQPNHLKSEQMGGHFVKNHLKSGNKCPDFDWASFQMVGTITIAIAKTRPFEVRPSKNLDFNCFQISIVSRFQMVVFQIYTVFGKFSLISFSALFFIQLVFIYSAFRFQPSKLKFFIFFTFYLFTIQIRIIQIQGGSEQQTFE